MTNPSRRRLVAVAAELAADHLIALRSADGSQHLCLFVADRLGVRPRGRLHRKVADDLQQVILDDVADRHLSPRRTSRARFTPKLSAIVIWTLSTKWRFQTARETRSRTGNTGCSGRPLCRDSDRSGRCDLPGRPREGCRSARGPTRGPARKASQRSRGLRRKQPACSRCRTTFGNMLGGIAR